MDVRAARARFTRADYERLPEGFASTAVAGFDLVPDELFTPPKE